MEIYKCMNENCKHDYTREKPGPTTCPKCGSLYSEWINFKADWEIDENGNWRRKEKN